MADGIQLQLESTLESLGDAKRKKIFSKQEIQSIVKQRTKFEYSIRARGQGPEAFLRYIEYEWSLLKLLKQRSSQMGDDYKTSVVDLSGPRRIHHLYRKAVSKFPGDYKLWIKYLSDAEKLDSSRKYPRILNQAVQLHPKRSEFWILSAKFEFKVTINVEQGRSIMQQALATNNQPKSEPSVDVCVELFSAWFKLEVEYVEHLLMGMKYSEKLKSRNQDIEFFENGETEDVGVSSEWTDEEFKKYAGDDVLLNYGIPKAILSESLKSAYNQIGSSCWTIQKLENLLVAYLDALLQAPGSEMIETITTELENLKTASALTVSFLYDLRQSSLESHLKSRQNYEKAVERIFNRILSRDIPSLLASTSSAHQFTLAILNWFLNDAIHTHAEYTQVLTKFIQISSQIPTAFDAKGYLLIVENFNEIVDKSIIDSCKEKLAEFYPNEICVIDYFAKFPIEPVSIEKTIKSTLNLPFAARIRRLTIANKSLKTPLTIAQAILEFKCFSSWRSGDPMDCFEFVESVINSLDNIDEFRAQVLSIPTCLPNKIDDSCVREIIEPLFKRGSIEKRANSYRIGMQRWFQLPRFWAIYLEFIYFELNDPIQATSIYMRAINQLSSETSKCDLEERWTIIKSQ